MRRGRVGTWEPPRRRLRSTTATSTFSFCSSASGVTVFWHPRPNAPQDATLRSPLLGGGAAVLVPCDLRGADDPSQVESQ
jgi:hypothetical protein